MTDWTKFAERKKKKNTWHLAGRPHTAVTHQPFGILILWSEYFTHDTINIDELIGAAKRF